MTQSSFDQALDLIEQSKFSEAGDLLVPLLNDNPHDARLNFSMALVDMFHGHFQSARNRLEIAAQVAPKKPVIVATLAEVLLQLREHEGARKAALKAVQLDPASDQAHLMLAHAYFAQQKTELARANYGRVLELSPDHVSARTSLCFLEQSVGNTEEAARLLQEAWQLNPTDPFVLRAAAADADFAQRDKVEENIRELLDTQPETLSPELRVQLSFALAKMQDERGDLDQSMKTLGRFRSDYYHAPSDELLDQYLSASKALFDGDFFAKRSAAALSSDQPVFIIGLPRSGTTLIEQALGRHRQAAGVGEQPFFTDMMHNLQTQCRTLGVYLESIRTTNPLEIKKIGQGYLKEIKHLTGSARRSIDKMPHNFEHLWLLALLFPKAKFIHATRNPADTCVSIYTTALNADHGYNETQESLARYYNYYAELMAHWKAVLPVDFHEVAYEDLVSNQEDETRKLLEFIGLDWDPACMEPHAGTRQVVTYSLQQIRKPVYTTSVGRWKRYEKHIKPLLDTLKEPAA